MTETVAADSDYLPLGFGYSAPTMLVLFVFINAIAVPMPSVRAVRGHRLGPGLRRVRAAGVRSADEFRGDVSGIVSE